MSLPENKHLRFLLILLYVLLALAGGYLFIKYAAGYVVPFIVAFIITRLIEPLISLLTKKCKIPRKLACAICTFLGTGIIILLVYLLISRTIYEISAVADDITRLVAGIPDALEEGKEWIGNLFNFSYAEEPLHPVIAAINSFFTNFSLPVSGIVSGITSAVSSLPLIIISIITTVVATYFMASDRENISAFFFRQFSHETRQKYTRLKHHLVHTLWRWLKAQLLLICITFGELLLGFVILGLEGPWVLAGAIALIDALPILGVGTILIPWCIISVLQGNFPLAIGLAILYAVIAVVRHSIEPKIVGQQIGLHPLVTLVSMYVGLQLFGFFGMFILPVAVITVSQLNAWGYIKLWKRAEDETV